MVAKTRHLQCTTDRLETDRWRKTAIERHGGKTKAQSWAQLPSKNEV